MELELISIPSTALFFFLNSSSKTLLRCARHGWPKRHPLVFHGHYNADNSVRTVLRFLPNFKQLWALDAISLENRKGLRARTDKPQHLVAEPGFSIQIAGYCPATGEGVQCAS